MCRWAHLRRTRWRWQSRCSGGWPMWTASLPSCASGRPSWASTSAGACSGSVETWLLLLSSRGMAARPHLPSMLCRSEDNPLPHEIPHHPPMTTLRADMTITHDYQPVSGYKSPISIWAWHCHWQAPFAIYFLNGPGSISNGMACTAGSAGST